MTTQQFIEEWFERRFGKDKSKEDVYFREWVDRFDLGQATIMMDKQSFKIWKQMKEEGLE